MRPLVRRALLLFALAAVLACAAAPVGDAGAARVQVLRVGWKFIVWGQTGTPRQNAPHTVGLVVVRGRWSDGHWHVITTVRTDADGRYRFAFRVHRTGWLRIRIVPPDKGDKHFVLHVS
jgi:hypothetical protein